MQIHVKRTGQVNLPAYQTEGASGLDLEAVLAAPVTIAPGAWILIPTGLSFSIPVGLEGQVRPRSGLAAKKGITVLNTPGTIDSDYRGEVKVILANFGPDPVVINPGDRIAQMVFCPVTKVTLKEVSVLDNTIRNEGGFGSTETFKKSVELPKLGQRVVSTKLAHTGTIDAVYTSEGRFVGLLIKYDMCDLKDRCLATEWLNDWVPLDEPKEES